VTVGFDAGVLSCVPRRLAEWQVDDGGRVVVERPKPGTTGVRGMVDHLRWLMSHPRIRFDELGSFVWQRLEGGETLAEIATATVEAFPDRGEGVEQRLALFATALQHQGLIELRVPVGD
jgi:hypothetical protein